MEERPIDPEKIQQPSQPVVKSKRKRSTRLKGVTDKKLLEINPQRTKVLRKETLHEIAESLGRMLDEEEIARLKKDPKFAKDVAAGKVNLDGSQKVDKYLGLVDEFGVPYYDQNPRKTTRRRRTPEERQIIARRIDQIRLLLSLSLSPTDIADRLSPEWKLKRTTIMRYVKLARKKQLSLLEATPEELKSDSLSFWSRELFSAITRRTRGEQELEKARQLQDKVEKLLEVENPSDKRLSTIDSILKRVQKLKEYGGRLITGAQMQAEAIRDRLDRLHGNLAPERVNLTLTNTKGEDVLHGIDPLNREQLLQQSLKLVQDAVNSGELDSSALQSAKVIEAQVLGLKERGGVPLDIPLEIVEEED